MEQAPSASAEAQLRAQTERLSRIISTQREIAAAHLDVDSVMQLICERIREVTNADSATILVFEGDHFAHRATTGSLNLDMGLKVPLEGSLTGVVHRTGEGSYADDSHTDPRLSSGLAAERGIRSIVAAPLRHGEQIIGQLQALCARPNAFSNADVDTLALLAVVVSLALSRAAELEASEALVRQAELNEHQALHDSLTGLPNRRKFFIDMKRELGALSDEGTLALGIFDLDGFKSYNDMFGHPAGDALLRRLADRLSAAVAGKGSAYRMGGDEFCVISRGPDGESVFRDARAALSDQGEGFMIGCSGGAALLPHDARSVEEALQLADRRLYATKRSTTMLNEGMQARDALVQVLVEKSQELAMHVGEVGELAAATATQLGLTPDQVAGVRVAAQLHDIGKVAIPEAILSKPGPLNDEEWRLMKGHTLIGERILTATPALGSIAGDVRSSHERPDGGGYPDGLMGEEIPLGARIVAVGDAFEAMTTDRPYKRAVTVDEAIAELRRCSGSQFDPTVVEAFINVLDRSGERVLANSALDPARK